MEGRKVKPGDIVWSEFSIFLRFKLERAKTPKDEWHTLCPKRFEGFNVRKWELLLNNTFEGCKRAWMHLENEPGGPMAGHESKPDEWTKEKTECLQLNCMMGKTITSVGERGWSGRTDASRVFIAAGEEAQKISRGWGLTPNMMGRQREIGCICFLIDLHIYCKIHSEWSIIC